MKTRIVGLVTVLTFMCACATSAVRPTRVGAGAAIGASVGAIGGAVLSPNDESRGLNALVFGLIGALVGGLAGIFTEPDHHAPKAGQDLKNNEFSSSLDQRKEYLVPIDPTLPEFVKDRLKTAVIEEYVERDSITEDGSLAEPHKVYRIKRPAELIVKPTQRPQGVRK